jgi:diguanylate cyclase (GGDEF)-like protein/PAS domain S-box-containing protein
MRRGAYIQPAVRSIAGGFILLSATAVYLMPEWLWLWLGLLFFVGFNLFQSGFTKFCILEKLLKKLNFRSETDEIESLNQANVEAEARAAFFDTLVLLNEVVIELGRDGALAFVSEHWPKLLGCTDPKRADFLGETLLSFVTEHDRATVHNVLEALLSGERDTMSLRFRMLRRDHHEHWVEGKFALYRKHDDVHGIRAVLRDVTEAHMQEKRISHMATHDALTGLPNRLFLDQRINETIALARSSGGKFALLFIDLDNFKRVNDLHGHKTGDQLLVNVSNILGANLRDGDLLARWGGDEFVVLLPFPHAAETVRASAAALVARLDAELNKTYDDAFLTLSIGIAIYPDDAQTGEALLVQADKALFHAKSQGRNNIQMFQDLRSGLEDAEMASRFVAAVKQGLLQVFYQPLIDAADHTRIVGVEALARWHDDKYGWVNPACFIPLAEDMGLIHELGRDVLDRAMAHFSQCDTVCAGIKLAVNVSKRQLASREFRPMLVDLVAQHGLRPEQIKLEITESIALEGIEKAKTCLQRLADDGFTLSLDDFGTGFSSLSHVHELPFNEIKIDISFVRRLKTPEGRILVKTITDMARAMQLTLVAEGVEDLETATILHEMGVQALQGYYFSPPMPREACAGFIEDLRASTGFCQIPAY